MDALSATDLQIFREKSRAFIGSVKIPLEKLRHEELPDNPRQRDEKNITRLLCIFECPEVGCQRRDSDNHVPVLIARAALPSRPLRVDGDFQLFNPDHPLIFLHGRHRIEAARKFLKGNDRWWIADLYSDDLSLQVKNVLREHDPNCAKFYDGDVLRQIRISTLHGDTARRQKLLAKLTKSKQDYIKRLEALPEHFWDSLDALIPFAGLWPAILIGTFSRLSNLHCPEEMTRYLRRVKATMTYIIGENENDWLLIDANTAFLLQGLCPGLSLKDRAFVQMRMLSGELFPAIQDENVRSQILEHLCSIKHVITTIHTFLEDTKYLEPCTRILKKILPGKSKGSLSQYFNALHSDQPNVHVQITEFTSQDRTLSGSHASWLLYRMLWLFTLRHFPVMDGQAPRKDTGKQNTWRPGLEYRWWVELSALALNNGYRRIRQLYRDRKAADISVIEECVRRILPSNYYNVDQELMRRKVKLINEIIGDIARVETVVNTPELTSAYDDCRPDISDRCGRPRVGALQSDEAYLFFDHIYSTSYDTTPQQYLTSFAITRDFFHSFFGTAEDDLDQPSIFRLPRDNRGCGREDEGRMQDVDDAEGPPANQRPASPPPPEAPLQPNPTRSVGERSNSTDRQRRWDLTSPRGGDTIFPGAVQQLLPAEITQAAAASSEDLQAEDTEMVLPWAPASARPQNTQVVIAPRSRSLAGRETFRPRGCSTSPTPDLHHSGRRRERSYSTDRRRRRSLTNARYRDSRIRDTIFPGSTQQLLLAGPPIESTQATLVSDGALIEDVEMVPWAPPSVEPQNAYPAIVPDVALIEDVDMVPLAPPSAGPQNAYTAIVPRSRFNRGHDIKPRGRSTSPTTNSYRIGRRRERSYSTDRQRRRSSARYTDSRIKDTIFPGSAQQLLLAGPTIESTQATIVSDDTLIEDVEMVPWTPLSAGPQNAHTAIVPRVRSFNERCDISPSGRSASPTTNSHGRRIEQSYSTDRQRRLGLTSARNRDPRIRDTIFPGSAQQLLIAGPPIESTHATVSDDALTEDTEMVPWAPRPAAQRVGKVHTTVASRSSNLDRRRKLTQRGRSTSPTSDTQRSGQRRERSTSSRRKKPRSQGSETPVEDLELVQWVPLPQTPVGPLVQSYHSATIPSVSTLPAAQPLPAPIFSQEILDRTFSTPQDIQLSAVPMLTFSEETMVAALPGAEPSAASKFVFSQEAQSRSISALAATRPAAAPMSVLGQNIQDGTISTLPDTHPSATPFLVSGHERFIEDITISLQDASQLIFRREIRTATRSFMVLSPAGRDRFRVCKVDSTNTVSMVDALKLASEAPIVTVVCDQDKRLKLAAPTTVLQKARAQKLDVALVAPSLNAGEIIRRLESFEEPGEVLRHKEPQPSLTVQEIMRRSGESITIRIWDGSDWKIAAKNVSYSQTEGKVRHYMSKFKGVRPYDGDASPLNVEDCFRSAQKESPPSVYLCLPEEASAVIEL